MSRYYIWTCPKGIESLYELMVFSPDKEPFMPLTTFYFHCSSYASNTAKTYLNRLVDYFNWLEQYTKTVGRDFP